tara:strand:+ start:1471 stop:1767 length:297 start_codon:yes stop_codon:yes gene_type:complete
MWQNILKAESEADVEEEVIETLKQVHEAAFNQYLLQYSERADRGFRITDKNKNIPMPKYLIVLEEALMKLGYDLPKEKRAGTHRYADVNRFKEIRQYR